MGNIDAGPHNGYGKPYLNYFKNVIPPSSFASSSAGARYYDFVVYRNDNKNMPMIHFFAINSNEWEPDGVDANSKQALWLKATLATSPCPFRVVYFHYLPYSFDNKNGPSPFMRWPFREWGASVVISGHAHVYQKIYIDGFMYLGMGLSGTPNIYALNISTDSSDLTKKGTFSQHFEGLVSFYNSTYGAQLIEIADDVSEMTITFHSVDGLYHDVVRFPRIVPGQNDNNNNNQNQNGNNNNNNQQQEEEEQGHEKLTGVLFGIVGTTMVCFVILAFGYCYKKKRDEFVHPLRNRSAVRAQEIGQRMQVFEAELLQNDEGTE